MEKRNGHTVQRSGIKQCQAPSRATWLNTEIPGRKTFVEKDHHGSLCCQCDRV